MLKDLLVSKRWAIEKRWMDHILDSYPKDTRDFLKSQSNRFANPVGASIAGFVEKLYDWLIQGVDSQPEALCSSLDEVIRIRAVQDFCPADAVGFIFLVKPAIRETLHSEIVKQNLFEELFSLEARIDSIALLAFDIYVQCRERIFDLKANEIRRRTSRMLERVCHKYGMPFDG